MDPNRFLKSIKCVWGEYPAEEIVSLIAPHVPYVEDARMVVGEFDGKEYSVGLSSTRLQNFKRSLVCVGCGRRGSVFVAEQTKSDALRCQNPHLNLYSADGELMTHDHVIPIARGGPRDSMMNTQTMCASCNCEKGHKMPGEM